MASYEPPASSNGLPATRSDSASASAAPAVPCRVPPGGRRELGWFGWLFCRFAARVWGVPEFHLFTVLAQHRRLFWAWAPFAGVLLRRGRLPGADTELAILRVGHLRGCEYELQQHRRIALRRGVDAATQAGIFSWPAPAGLSGRQQVLLAAVDELVARRSLSDDSWRRLSGLLDRRQLIEFVTLVGQYDALAMTLTTLGVPLDYPEDFSDRERGASVGSDEPAPTRPPAELQERHVGYARTREAVSTTGAAMGEAIGIFMLHPETFAGSIAAGYQNPFAGYVAGRGGVLGEATGSTVASVFAIFEPNFVCALWDEGVAVRGAAGAATVYWDQVADFGHKYLSGAQGTARIAALSEKIIAGTPGAGLPMYAGWRAMPLAEDAAARAFQTMFVLREMRGDVHFNVLVNSGITPVEAHMLHGGEDYTRMFGWPEPFADGADKKLRYAEVEEATNRRMGEIFGAALDDDETEELARLSAGALEWLKAHVPPAG